MLMEYCPGLICGVKLIWNELLVSVVIEVTVTGVPPVR